MKTKYMYMYGFLLLVIIIITISCVFYTKKTTNDDLSKLHIAISNRDMKMAEEILQKYYSDTRFVNEAKKYIIEITDEEIVNLSDDNIEQLLQILNYLKSSTYGNESIKLTNMYNTTNKYITIKNIDNYVNDYGYIETHKYLKNFIYDTNSIISNIARTKMKELENGVIDETIIKAREYIEKEDFDKASNLLAYCSSWENEEINQLYSNIKDKVPQKNDTNYTNNTLEKGMTQSEVVEICGEPNHISKKGNINDKNKGNFGKYDEVWYYSIPQTNKNLKFGVFFLNRRIVGISANVPDSKLMNPVSVLTVNTNK